MPNLPSVSYMIGQFQDAISGRKTEKGGKSLRELKYWSLDAMRVTILLRTIKLRPSNAMYHL